MTLPIDDHAWMKVALRLAEFATTRHEVPVGAVIVHNGKVIGTGFNLRETHQDPTAHAELIAIREASQRLQTWRLTDCTLYVTLEPCTMCAGLLHQTRIGRVVFGASDPKSGSLGSLYSLHDDPRLNHQFPVTKDIQPEASAALLKDFFQQRRKTSR